MGPILQDEVPTLIMDAHVKNVREASEANAGDPAKAGLEKSGIAGTEPEDSGKGGEGKDKDGKDDAEKKDGEAMAVSGDWGGFWSNRPPM